MYMYNAEHCHIFSRTNLLLVFNTVRCKVLGDKGPSFNHTTTIYPTEHNRLVTRTREQLEIDSLFTAKKHEENPPEPSRT